MPLLRVEGLRGYRELVAELRGDPDRLLVSAGIDPAALDSPENFVSYVSVIALLEDSARVLGCPDFGLRLSQYQGIGILGPLAVAMQNSSTVGDALACASRYIYIHSPAIAFSVRATRDASRMWVVFEILLDRVPSAVQVTELSVGLTARVFALLARGHHRVTGVRFPHARHASIARYRSHFSGVPVVFGAEHAALEFEEAALSQPIAAGDRALQELAEDYLQLRYDAPLAPFAERVRSVVRRSLGTERSGCLDVSSALAVHPRTLQRRLSAEGTHFERIKDEARAALARRYLEQPDLPLSQVASLLDYAEQSALSRSCRRWFGCSPRALRAELLARASGS